MTDDLSKNSTQIKKTKRRDFLNVVLGGGFIAWLGALFFPVFKYLEPPVVEEVKVSNIKIGAVEDMEKDSGKIVKFGNKPVIVIRKQNGDYLAFGAVCTHLDCIVQYRKDYGQIYCACHNGRYDLNGRVASGPPPAPLTKYGVTIKNDEVIIFQEAS
ncbi:MAG TPA: Rieske (2Fe-2S) protein [Ignavibacteriaceae bacterium]